MFFFNDDPEFVKNCKDETVQKLYIVKQAVVQVAATGAYTATSIVVKEGANQTWKKASETVVTKIASSAATSIATRTATNAVGVVGTSTAVNIAAHSLGGAVTAATTGVIEGISFGVDCHRISKNEKLSREDKKKAIANSAVKGVVRGGSTIAGTIVGGLIGSLVGPAGTLVGSFAGSLAGSLVGGVGAWGVSKLGPEY